MESETHMVTASKVPTLKPGEYEIWKMRMRQYIKMIDYAMWDVILTGDKLPTTGADGKLVPIKSNEDMA